MFDTDDERYIDFLCGAGSLNYGHNHPALKSALVEYLRGDGIIHSLDLHTEAKQQFIQTLQSTILEPRRLTYKQQFTGPTGANAVEAALKLARKVTGRSSVVAFTNAYHGVSLGALAATASPSKRLGAGIPLDGVIRLPYDGFLGGGDDARWLEAMLCDPGAGVDPPAAIILETIQGEGGLQIASAAWLRRVAAVAAKIGALIIIDDIQAGCGRTGTFFSFEGLPITPDIVCLSKSLSGIGLPLSLVLLAPQYDIWKPGEHNGTFRGNNLAFVCGEVALSFWADDAFQAQLQRNIQRLDTRLEEMARSFDPRTVALRGRGMMRGVEVFDPETAQRIQDAAFRRRLIVETCGPTSSVIKLMPALTISSQVLEDGLDILAACLGHALPARAEPVNRPPREPAWPSRERTADPLIAD